MKPRYPCVHPVSLKVSRSLGTSQVNSAQMWDWPSKQAFLYELKRKMTQGLVAGVFNICCSFIQSDLSCRVSLKNDTTFFLASFVSVNQHLNSKIKPGEENPKRLPAMMLTKIFSDGSSKSLKWCRTTVGYEINAETPGKHKLQPRVEQDGV